MTMKDETSRKVATTGREETKDTSVLPQSFRFFEDWDRTIMEDFQRIDSEIDRRFRDFQDTMFRNRDLQLEDFRKDFQSRPKLTGLQKEE